MMDGLHHGDSEDGERNIDFDYYRDKSHTPNNRMDGFFGNGHHSLDRRTADGTYFSNHQNGSWPRNLTCDSCGRPYSYRHRPTIANRIYSSTSEMDAPLVTSRPIYGDKNMRYDGFHRDERTLYSANRPNRLERSDYSFCEGNSTLERDFAFHGGKEMSGLPSGDDHNILGTSTMKHPRTRSKDSRVSFRDGERRGNEVGKVHFGPFFGDRENGYNAKGRQIWNVRNGDDIYNDSGDDTSFSNKSRNGYPSWMYRHTIDKENNLGRYMDVDQCVNSISGDCDTCRDTFPERREGFLGICRCASGRGETLFRDRSPTFGAPNIDTSLGRNRDFSNHSKWITDEFHEDYPSVYHDTSIKQDSLAGHRDGSFSVNSFLSAHEVFCDDIDSSFSEHRVPSTEYNKYPVYNGYSTMMSESDEKGRGSFSIHDNSADRYHIIANGNTVNNREEDKDYHLTGARLHRNEPHDDSGHHPGNENVSSDHYIVNRESNNHYNNTVDKTVRVESSNGTVAATANKNNDDNDDDDDDDTNSDDEYDSVYGREDLVVIDKNCCVRSILMAVVVTTGILVITIVASKNKLGEVPQTGAHKSVEQDVWWTDGEWGRHQLVFKDQFLLHDTRDHHPVQVLAIDDVRQIYVIMKMDNDSSKHYNLYLLVNFEEKTETVVIILKSENEYSTDVIEDKVILCQKRRFDREFHGNFAPVSSVMLSSTAENKLNSTRKELTIDYIGAPLKLGKLMSTVVNSTCERLEAEDKFIWDETDESLACGTTQSEETELESCPQNLCHSFPGIPLSKGQTCHKFRKCNFMMATCSRNYQFGLAEQEEHPYCACRKTAAEDAERLACPRVSDDGGECEIPRRDLLITQKTSPCLCLYNILMIYPFYSQGLDSSEDKDTVINGDLKWRIKEETVVGPALTFSKCPC